MSRGWLRRLRRVLVLVGVWLVVLLIVQIGLHARLRSRLARRALADHSSARLATTTGLPLDVAHAVGMFDVAPARRDFTASRPSPPSDTIRIGAFGDSFTFGDEVADGLEFPAHLQRRFAREGMSNVEILNFGSPGHGFAQQYYLWDRYGRKMGLDFTLFGPETLFRGRDDQFEQEGAGRRGIYHGRYTLDDAGGLTFRSPTGSTAKEQDDAYNSLWPSRLYAAYDRTPLAFIRGWLPEGLTVRNPFYYSRWSSEDEREALYRALFAAMSTDDDLVVMNTMYTRFPQLIDPVAGHILSGRRAALGERIYRRERGHYSSLGNRLVADLYFDALMGRGEGTLRLLRLLPFDVAVPSPPSSTARPLSELSRIRVAIDGRVVGSMVQRSRSGGALVEVDFAAEGILSLLAIGDGSDHPFGYALVPLHERLPVGEKVIIDVQTESGFERFESWPIRRLHPDVEIGYARSDVVFHSADALAGPFLGRAPGAPKVTGGTISLRGRPLLHGVPGEILRLLPNDGSLITPCPGPNDDVDFGAIANEGALEVILDGKSPARAAIGRYVLIEEKVPFRDAGMRRKIVRGPDGRAEIVNRRTN